MRSTDVTSVLADGQQPEDTHTKSVSSAEEQIDPVSASQSCTQGNDTTNSEPVPGQCNLKLNVDIVLCSLPECSLHFSLPHINDHFISRMV